MEDDADFLHGKRDRTRVQVLGLLMSLMSLEFRILVMRHPGHPGHPKCSCCSCFVMPFVHTISYLFEVGCNRSRASQKEASRWYACASRALAKYWMYWTLLEYFLLWLSSLDKLILTSFQGVGSVFSEDLSFLDAHVMAEYGARASCVFRKASISTKKAAWGKSFECP